MDKLNRADLLIFQFPLWWLGAPAILKGWVDRVFAAGYAYGAGKCYDNGVFNGRRAMLALTTGGLQTMYSETGLHGEINQVLFPIKHGMLAFTGFDVLPPFVAWGVSHGSDAGREDILDAWEAHLRHWQNATPLEFQKLDDYDQSFQLKAHVTAA
jgi:NAD(P)H dehydrogenase (quinone)